MPLIEYVGNATPQDRNEIIKLNQASDGSPRSLEIGKRALVSGDELQSLASSFQIRVVEDTDEEDSSAIPAKMPSGYDESGYKEGESPSIAVFTAEDYPDEPSKEADSGEVADVSSAATASAASAGTTQKAASDDPPVALSPPDSSSSSVPSPSPSPVASPAASGTPAAAPSTQSAAASSSPDSPGASG